VKTQILHLEPHDDTISARDKMGWSQAGRILMIWPDRGRPLSRKLDLVLILRHSARIGAQVALVTRDPEVRSNARELGIPVFRNARQAQRRSWNAGRRRRWQYRPYQPPKEPHIRPDLEALRREAHPPGPEWLDRPWARLIFFTAAVAAVLAFSALFIPGAEIHLEPQTRVQSLTQEFLAAADGEQGDLPLRSMVVSLEGVLERQVSGTLKSPSRFATGEVVFTNLTLEPVRIPLDTVVSTLPKGEEKPVRFQVSRGGTVPAGPESSLTLPVRAVLPGSESNLPAGSLVAIESSLGLSLVVNNPKPVTGGQDTSLPAPTLADYEALETELQQSLALRSQEEARDHLAQGDLLLPGGAVRSRILTRTFEPAKPQPAERLKLRLQIEFECLSVRYADLRALAEAALDLSLPGGFSPVSGSLELEAAPGEPTEEGAFPIRLQARRVLKAQVSEQEAVRLALGQPREAVQARLASALPLANPPQVQVFPSGWPRMPVLPFRIRIFEPANVVN